MSKRNKELVRRYYAEGMALAATSEPLRGIEQIVSGQFVDHHFPPGLPPGPDGAREFFQKILGSIFSGMKIEIGSMLAEADKVDCHFTLLARHTGEFAGIAPRGNPIRCPAVSTFRIEDGKLAEAWEIFDSGKLLDQMRGESAGARPGGKATRGEFYDSDGRFRADAAKSAFLEFMRGAGYPVNDAIAERLFVTDFNLGRFTEVGLAAIVWWGDPKNNYSGLDAFLLPGQIIPEHWHARVGAIPEKMECWLVRHGEVYAYSEGDSTPNRRAAVPKADAPYLTVNHERILRVGEIAGLDHPLEKHWMQAGPQGAIFTEFCTFHSGEAVRFTDPKIKF